LRGAELLDLERQFVLALFDFEYAADKVALAGPEMEQALPVLAGDGVTGGGELEEDLVVFSDGGARVASEIELEGAGELGSVYGVVSYWQVSDQWRVRG
jgi:hypothetical protein